MARRLVERGVRYVQVCVNDQIWDSHSHLEDDLRSCCDRTDQPVAALLRDLKERGLLDSTLVIWTGEFGRHPIAQIMPKEGVAGRDHNPRGFSLWMAGGGVKGGTVYGSTDEFGYRAVENPVSIEDFHATVLHLLGLNHEELFFERNGLNEKITFNFKPKVVKDILI
jgi:arylsulfatase A-like enzyme